MSLVNTLRNLGNRACDRLVDIAKPTAVVAALAAMNCIETKVPFVNDRIDVGGFSATLKPNFTTNDARYMHLRSAQLIVGETGSYEAQILFKGEAVALRSFSVSNTEPLVLDFDNLTSLGGLAGLARKEGFNFGWANFPGQFEISLTKIQADGSRQTQVTKF